MTEVTESTNESRRGPGPLAGCRVVAGVVAVPPARLGEHTRDVLGRWLALGDEEMDQLEAKGAIFSA
jgi:hypothetical protein